MKEIEFIAFDLDGTLLDTAQDFLIAVNRLRSKHSFPSCELEEVRIRVSEGALSLTNFALDLRGENQNKIQFYKNELLEIYNSCCLDKTVPFDGINNLLTNINKSGLKWGIVTNKPKKFAKKIVHHFFSSYRPSCLICPEDAGERKPSPKGLLKACLEVDSNPTKSIYIGDHHIDIEAGKNAEMITIAAAYGYIPEGQNPSNWGAEFIAKSPEELNSIIFS